MTDDEIIERLKVFARSHRPVEVAEELGRLRDDGLTEGALVTYFKRAFPSTPLQVLRDSGAWHRVSGGDLTDDDLDGLLRSWLGQDAFHTKAALECTPSLVDLEDQLRRWRWLVRFARPLPDPSSQALGASLQTWAASELRRLYLNAYEPTRVERACPRITAYQLDELRYVLEIVFAGIGREVEHSYLVSTFGVLHHLHQRHGLDELQGLPPNFWYFLKPDFHVGPRESF
jgi:hypothetical protein